MNLKTEIINGEIKVTLDGKLEDWDKVKFIIDTYLEGFKNKPN